MTELTAAFLLAQPEKLDAIIATLGKKGSSAEAAKW